MVATMSKSKLKARLLEVLRRLEESSEELIITDHSRPVLKIVPIKKKSTVSVLFSGFQGRVIYHEDITTPTYEEWNEV